MSPKKPSPDTEPTETPEAPEAPAEEPTGPDFNAVTEVDVELRYKLSVKDTIGNSFDPKLTTAEVQDLLEARAHQLAKADKLKVIRVGFELNSDKRRIICTARCASESD